MPKTRGCPYHCDSATISRIPLLRLPLSYLVTQLRIQRNDGWGIARWCLVTKCIYSCYLFCFFVRNIECSRHSFRKLCWTALTTGAGKIKGRKPQPCHWVGELEEEGCLLYLEEEWRCSLLSYGPWSSNLSFFSSIKFFPQWSQNVSFFWKLFIYLVRIFVKFVYKSTECFQKADNFLTHCAMKTPTANNRKKMFYFNIFNGSSRDERLSFSAWGQCLSEGLFSLLHAFR